MQGDIIWILNSSGTAVVTYGYNTWDNQQGDIIAILDSTGTVATTVGADNPFRYRGYYYDTETSLYYLNQRYYNPEWGRFINADDYMGSTGGLLSHNVFAYCANNPVIRVDESGQFFMLVAGLVGAVVGAVVGGVVAAATGGDVLKGALIGGAAGGLIGLTCGAAASVVATAGSITGATALASTGTVMGGVSLGTASFGAVTNDTLVIGQHMDKVAPAAQKIGAEIYNGWGSFTKFSETFGKKAAEIVGALDNGRFLIGKLMQNYKIIDIGLDLTNKADPSLAYKVEQAIMRVYEYGKWIFK